MIGLLKGLSILTITVRLESYLIGGIRWYRKTLELSQDDAGKQIYLDIDGAMSYVSVWCNGQYVGGWPYGYASFSS